MKNLLITSLLLIVSLFSFTLPTLAQSNTLEPVDCFAPDLYKFQSVQVSVGPEETAYTAGDTINFSGQVINENKYPVVDGNVFVRISKTNPNDDVDTIWHNVVDEFIAVSDLSINGQSSTSVAFSWKAPVLLGQGDYRADYFFSVGKRFNLGGLPFTNEIIIGTADFNIKNSADTIFALDRNQTKVNDEAYKHIGNWPSVKTGEQIRFTQPLKNLSDKAIEVTVRYDLYYWDSLRAEDKIETKTEQVKVPAKSSVDLSYLVEKANVSVYYLKITATMDGVSSLVNLRAATEDVVKQRINYPAVNQFPLLKGKEATLFSCFHMTSYTTDDSKLVLTLTDKRGNVITTGDYETTINPGMSAAQLKFVPPADYDTVNLKAELFNSKNELVDHYEAKYDCRQVGGEACRLLLKAQINNLLAIVGFFLLCLIITLITLGVKGVRTNPKSKKILSLILVLLVLVIIALLSVIASRGVITDVFAEEITDGGRTKTETKSSNYDITGFSGNRLIFRGNLSYTHRVTLNGGEKRNDNRWYFRRGTTFSFTRTGSCQYDGVGGVWDTPVCGNNLSFKDYGKSKNQGITTIDGKIPNVGISVEDNTKISCSGLTCTANDVGCTNLSVNIGSMSFKPKACVEWEDGVACTPNWLNLKKGRITLNESNVSLSSYSPNWWMCVYEDNACGSASGQTVSAMPMGSGACSAGSQTSIATTTTQFIWNCDVSGVQTSCSANRTPLPSSLSATCSVSPNPAAPGGTVAWTVVPTGGTSPYTYSWIGTGLNGKTGVIATTSYSNTGTYYATTTVRDSLGATYAAGCYGVTSNTCSGCGGGGRHPGVKIFNSSCGSSVYTCSPGVLSNPSSNGSVDNTIYTWDCLGFNSNPAVTSDDTSCTASGTPDLLLSLPVDCREITLSRTSPINVNLNTTLTASPSVSCPDCTVRWGLREGATGEIQTVSGVSSRAWDKIFTTVGQKTITAQFVNLSGAGAACTVNLDVVLQGGSVNEI